MRKQNHEHAALAVVACNKRLDVFSDVGLDVGTVDGEPFAPRSRASFRGARAKPAWHLCTATEYRARGGTVAGGSPPAWLQACVRDGTGVMAPTDSACSSCSSAAAVSEPIAWSCGAGTWLNSNNVLYIGVRTHFECNRAGANVAAAEANWRYHPAQNLLSAAVCCK